MMTLDSDEFMYTSCFNTLNFTLNLPIYIVVTKKFRDIFVQTFGTLISRFRSFCKKCFCNEDTDTYFVSYIESPNYVSDGTQ